MISIFQRSILSCYMFHATRTTQKQCEWKQETRADIRWLFETNSQCNLDRRTWANSSTKYTMSRFSSSESLEAIDSWTKVSTERFFWPIFAATVSCAICFSFFSALRVESRALCSVLKDSLKRDARHLSLITSNHTEIRCKYSVLLFSWSNPYSLSTASISDLTVRRWCSTSIVITVMFHNSKLLGSLGSVPVFSDLALHSKQSNAPLTVILNLHCFIAGIVLWFGRCELLVVFRFVFQHSFNQPDCTQNEPFSNGAQLLDRQARTQTPGPCTALSFLQFVVQGLHEESLRKIQQEDWAKLSMMCFLLRMNSKQF